ncbi:endonuclease 8-like 1 [Triplophysa rosa]|uniref:Endonuclease 8-like 1 n=1 Tax=Triplophysa rosa TaxID=992332 RepID=A0A9W7X133_TRIRA|nr:endonuclease 8-like 1 [Triplophysa rosa]XP_057185945.1 endonuclease 8-like 1 [Triplophysa rosa]KAI7811879.1 nei endonuclease VIII-like 1 [Triplophysa rosa]
MPEGPELHLASLFVNRVCEGVVFTGPVEKSDVSKCPEVPFCCDAYRIKAQSRGKETRLTLTPIKNDDDEKSKVDQNQSQQPVDVVFRFGMSGFFRFTTVDELPKHAHLRFYTNETPRKALSFVDPRRFGGWQPNGSWQADRGPCIIFEYQSFRENVLSNLSDKAFDRPICEALLNQKYFNGVGNYLRAEILYRSRIPPFVNARTVLQGLELKDEDKKKVKAETAITETADTIKIETETPDLLSLCHTVPLEVVKLGGKGYDPQTSDYSTIIAWMQCYGVDGMKSIRDRNGRTMWFKGDPGPMAPKDFKSPKGGKRKVQQRDHDYTDSKKAKKNRTGDGANKKPVKQKEIKNIKEETKTSRSQRGSKRQKNDEKAIDAEETKRPNARKRSGTAGTKGQNKKQANKTKNRSATCRKSTTKEKPKRKSSRGRNT